MFVSYKNLFQYKSIQGEPHIKMAMLVIKFIKKGSSISVTPRMFLWIIFLLGPEQKLLHSWRQYSNMVYHL